MKKNWTRSEWDIYTLSRNEAVDDIRYEIWSKFKGTGLLPHSKTHKAVSIMLFLDRIKALYNKTHLTSKEAYRLAWQCIRFDKLMECVNDGYCTYPEIIDNPFDDMRWRMIPTDVMDTAQKHYDDKWILDRYHDKFVWRCPFADRDIDTGIWFYNPDPIPF